MLATIKYEITKALQIEAEKADMDRIISLAVDLTKSNTKSNNVKQETITSVIHKALEKEAESLPKARFLYCGS